MAWLGNLAARSIDNWTTFANDFVESFATSRDEDELKEDLFHIKMVEGVKLRDFLNIYSAKRA